MSCGYLYEIRRKSEEFESSQKPQHVHLRTFSEEEDDEIWEVPEESFDNAYQTITENEDEDENKIEAEEENVDVKETASSKNPSNILQNFEIFSAQRLRLSLSAEQISLKSQQQQWEAPHKADSQQQTIKKSIKTEADVQTRPVLVCTNSSSASTTTTTTTTLDRCKAADCSSAVNWKNVKINNKTKENEQNASAHLSAIPPIPLIFNETHRKFQMESDVLPEIKNYSNISHASSSTQKSEQSRKFSLGSATMQTPHIDLGPQTDYCSSSESFVGNILSNLSSVSVQSSSLSSGILTDDGEELKVKNSNPFKIVDRIDERNTKRNLREHKVISDKKSHLNRCCQQAESEHPFIMITQPSLSTSSSTINNLPLSVTSSESYETATTISRRPSLPISDALVVHASSPEPPQYPEELLCQICRESFKDPRCLNCLHTFCLQCIVNENFKEDESNPFWTTPTKNNGSVSQSKQNISQNEQNLRASSSSRGSSASPDYKTDSTCSDLLAPNQKLRSSFSFKLRRPSDSPIKAKLEGSGTSSDNSTISNNSRSQSNISTKIICKICQHSMDVPAGGIRQLPQNLMVVRKIHEFQFKLMDRGNSCSLCYEETNASYHCETCSLNLCTLCKESHARQKTTANHDIKQIEKLQKDQKASNNSNIKLKCNLHQVFDVKSFCTTCLQVACTDCLILHHKGHKYEAIPKASQCYARLLRDSTDQARLLLKSTENSLNKLNEFSESINQKCDALQRDVEEFMGKYIEAVEAHKMALMQQINQARETKLSMISNQQSEIEKHNQEALTAITFSQELTDIASGVEILSFVKIMLKRLEHCQQFRSPVDAKLANTPNFFSKIQAPPSKEMKEIPVFGIITTQTVEPTQCTLQWNGFSQLRLHKKVDLTLISRDADGLPMSHGGLKIQSHVKYKDVNSKCLRMEITDNNDGTYSIAFTPDTEGTIILMITINDKHIKGSPFSFLSRPVRPHTGIYHCCTFCSSKGNKFATCSCDGHMPGYSGCGHGHTGHPGHRHWSCCGDVLRNSECQFSNRSLNPK